MNYHDDDRICKQGCDRGHITLRCRNHPEKTWSTKNLGYSIGARHIFYNLSNDPNMGPECACPLSDLYHDHARDPSPYVHVG